jgi:hypothetical protein
MMATTRMPAVLEPLLLVLLLLLCGGDNRVVADGRVDDTSKNMRAVLEETSDFFRLFRFQPAKLDKKQKQRWYRMHTDEKLPYLFDSREVRGYLIEFATYFPDDFVIELQSDKRETGDEQIESVDQDESSSEDELVEPLLPYELYYAHNIEFQDEDSIAQIFKFCDKDHDQKLNFREYFLCRCEYSRYGRQHTGNEIDVRETSLMLDYETMIRASGYVEEGVVYDANGIIIEG